MPRLHRSRVVGDFGAHPPMLALERVIHSLAQDVHDAVKDITAFLKRVDWFDDMADIDLVALAISEALNNALVHGNRCDPEKTISVSVALNDDGSLFVSIKDSGSGFNPNTLPNPLAVENRLSNHGRGIFLIRQFMDEVEFKFEHGAEVRMRRRQNWSK